MQLSDYIGTTLDIMIPWIDPTFAQSVKLLGVEAGGIWVESQTLTNHALKVIGQTSAPKSLAFFFPYHAVQSAFAAIEGPALDEKAFLG